MLTAADLGAGFEDRPYRSTAQGVGPCVLDLPDVPSPVERLGAGYASNTALENAHIELVIHADAASASVAYAGARRDSACTGEENREGGAPRPSDIVGADEAFSIG